MSARRVSRVEYVPSVEVFAMSEGFGIEWTGEKGYAGQVQYRTPAQVLEAVENWMNRQAALQGEDPQADREKVS